MAGCRQSRDENGDRQPGGILANARQNFRRDPSKLNGRKSGPIRRNSFSLNSRKMGGKVLEKYSFFDIYKISIIFVHRTE